MLQKTTIEILVEGLSQKFDEKVRPDAKLERADNVEVNKAAKLNKRRGYRLVDVTGNDPNGLAVDSLFTKCAVRSDELVVFSDHVYSVLHPTATIGSTSVLRRGPVIRGSYRLRTIIAGPGSSEEA